MAKCLNACFIILSLIFFSKNNVLSPNQSEFRPGDFYINQLLSINHEILSAFDKGLKVCGIFLDISKAFDKVWYHVLILKLGQNGNCGEMINILEEFQSDRKKRVVLNGQCFSWADIRTSAPKGSISGPWLFLIYIKDLSNDNKNKCKLFADDTSVFVVHDIGTSANNFSHDLEKNCE